MRDENGLEKCVACGLCSVACPADAIYLEAAENDGTVLAGPRYASVYQIHKTRCIFCGMCEEACPVSAIFMGKDYELAVYSKDDFIWDKSDLLVASQSADAKLSCHREDDHRRRRRHPRKLRRADAGDGTPSRRAAVDLRRRPGQPHRRISDAAAAAVLDQGQQRRLRAHCGLGSRRGAAAQPPLHPQRHRGRGRELACRRPRRDVCAEVVRGSRRGPATWPPRRGAREARRQATAFRARRSRGVQAACADRHPDDARGGAPVHRGRRAAIAGATSRRRASMRASRRSTRCSPR